MRPLAPLLSLVVSLGCALSFSGCGDDGSAPGSSGINDIRPPAQQSIYLRNPKRESRPPGAEIFNSKTLTMSDASLIRRSGDQTVTGTADMLLRDVWTVDVVSENERTYSIDEMSFSQKSEIGGKPLEQSLDSDLASVESFRVTREQPDSKWEYIEQELSGLQELELKTIGDMWNEGSHVLYPEEPLEMNQSWSADPKALSYIMSPRLQIDNGEVTCRLQDITVHRGERCAEVAIDIDISGVLKTQGSSTNVQIALKGTIIRSLQSFFDMRTELEGTMQWEMEFPVEKSSVSIDGIARYIGISELKVDKSASKEADSTARTGS